MTDNASEISQTLGLQEPRSRNLRRVLIAVALVVLSGVGWWFFRADAGDGPRYVTVAAAHQSFEVEVTATGTIEPTNLVEISSELSGTLASVKVDYNDRVEVGSILAELDTVKLEALLAVRKAALDASIARVSMAQASLDEATEKYRSIERLEERGITSHQEYVSHRAAFVRAQSELQSARADRALAEAQLDLQKAELDNACICSPIDGVVLDRAVDAGQIVASALSAPVLFVLAEDLAQMELQVDIDEADIGRVKIGQPAEFVVDAYDERRFPASITELRFAPETVDGVVTYKAILSIDNSDLLLRPGMTATADITVVNLTEVLAVPNAALRYAPPVQVEDEDRAGLLGMLLPQGGGSGPQGDIKTLWVLREGLPTEIAVKPGATNGKVTQIIEGVLSAGDLVITDQVDG